MDCPGCCKELSESVIGNITLFVGVGMLGEINI
ncbi:MAG: hypothetical protein FKGGLIKP_00352 [Sodalis sp. Fse]|nr:MAG: hypothetical protein FKGGLIKP_00352 [Sodalis sp. Fse]UVK78723.1 MAG: hypothetical protein IGNPGNKH_00184 [Sodalis sp. Ffu]